MELGEKLRLARMEAGLSQRALAGEEITRNMLSQIENGTARPSMKTLGYLAGRLGKTVSYFLEEEAVVSPNQKVMTQARNAYDSGDFAGAVEALKAYREPDEIFDREKGLIWSLSHMALAQKALGDGREPYARELLEAAAVRPAYCAEELERRRLLLLGQLRGGQVSGKLPSLDTELILRAGEALADREFQRAAALLEAVQDQSGARWNLLRGEVYFVQENFGKAVRCLRLAEEAFPRRVYPKLEACFRELGDYKHAYEYACKQR